MGDNLFSLKVNHGGKLIRDKERASYLGGTVSMMSDLDPDKFIFLYIERQVW